MTLLNTAAERDRMAAGLAEVRPLLDERARRLLLGAESRAIGYRGIKVVAARSKATLWPDGKCNRGDVDLAMQPAPRDRRRVPNLRAPASR